MRLTALLAALWLFAGWSPAFAQIESGSGFLSPQMRSQQNDPTRNPGYFWVDQGRELFSRKPQAAQACSGCHAAPETSLRGAATRYPQVDASDGRLLNL